MTMVDRDSWLLALRQLTDTLKLLDESNAPLEVGAQIDLAIHRLRAAAESRNAPHLRAVAPTSACSNN